MTTTLAAPTVVLRSDAAPAPRAEVTVTPVGDTATVSVLRSDPAGTLTVRGGYRQPSAGGATLVVDYEIPFGVPVRYAVIAYNAAGAASPQSPWSAPVTMPDPVCPWLADSLVPTSAIRISPTDWSTRNHTRESTVLWPVTTDSAVVLANTKPRPTSVMQLLTYTAGEAARLLTVLAATTVIFRPPSQWDWPGGYYYLDGVDETRLSPKVPTDERRLWDMTFVPVIAPPPVLIVTVVTWGVVLGYYNTWADLINAKHSWLDVVRNPDPGSP
jgi:hypothetical protein